MISRTGWLLSALLCFGPAPLQAQTPESRQGLVADFENPPQSARPQVWWHWMSGNVTWEGAKADLDWMHSIGIGGVGAFSGGSIEDVYVPKPLPFMSPGWTDVFHRSLDLARQDGMDFMIAGSPGWSETGAPWVTPADAMKKYTWSETVIEGDVLSRIRLPQPPSATGPLQAIARSLHLQAYRGTPEASGDGPVIAFPDPAPAAFPSATFISGSHVLPAIAALPVDLSGTVSFSLNGLGGSTIEIQLAAPATVGALRIAANPLPGLTLTCLDCGSQEKTLFSYLPGDHEILSPQQTITFIPVTGSRFRLTFDVPVPQPALPGKPPSELASSPASEIRLHLVQLLSPGHIDRFEAKAGFQVSPYPYPELTDNQRAATGAISAESVVDLSKRVRPDDGTLNWTPPPGRWRVIRFGWSLTGAINEPAEPSATGLEVDKLNAEDVRRYADTLFQTYRYQAHVQLGGKGVNELFTDSWEVGPQNWTVGILQAFRHLRGYDPTPWLPVLAGWVVNDPRSSNAFLNDYRQTLQDMVVRNHYDVLEEEAHRHGMLYYTEDQGDTPRSIADGMTVKAQSDVPTGELWFRPFDAEPGQPALVTDLRESASAAHVYGKQFVAAESFTKAAGTDPWSSSPAAIKLKADEEFGLGVNRILIHESHLQPFLNRAPGLELDYYGISFTRNQTWAADAKPLVQYLSRSSFLLQQGYAVADVAYLYGEERNLTEIFHHTFNEDVPPGYNYDYLNAQGLLDHIHFREGSLVSDDGNRYRLLYLSRYATRLHLDTLQKLVSLVQQGAVLVGVRPQGMLGLGSSAAQFRALCDELWGSDKRSEARYYGAGRVYPTTDLGSVLSAEGFLPDIAIPPTYNVLFQHRHTPEAEIYFLHSRTSTPQEGWLIFRTTGLVPELWSATTGHVRPLSYRMGQTGTAVHLPLRGHEAAFVVFRGKTATPVYTVAAESAVSVESITAPWTVAFQAGRGAPASIQMNSLTDWAASPDAGIRYFSGTATYRTRFSLPPAASQHHVRLDLGSVSVIAELRVNDHPVGTLWYPPYVADITRFVQPGTNTLEIRVTNLWTNRLIGDKQPGGRQFAYAPQSTYTSTSPLLPSGLLGPVRIVELAQGDPHH